MAVKQQKGRTATGAPVLVEKSSRPDIPAFLKRHARTLAIALVLLATVRIVSTYMVYNHTFDEPAHIACGTEWWADGVYRWEAQHPPLSRAAVSFLPYLLGARPQGEPRVDIYSMTREGTRILYSGRNYDLWLAMARAGNLPLFWIACFVVYQWGRRYFGPAEAVAALFVFTFTPPVLAHAALATTDMALTALMSAGFLAGLVWIERPSVKTGVVFGAVMGFAFLAKFSLLVYFPAAAAIALLWYLAATRPKRRWLQEAIRARIPAFALAVLVSLPIIWAGYRFSFGTPKGAGFRMPAPEIYEGIQEVLKHNREGHPGYLLGEIGKNGFLMFYPVAIAVKTPLAVLVLLVPGIVLAIRGRGLFQNAWLPVCYAAGILIPALASHINIGIRHILPIYTPFALLAGAAAVWLFDPARTKKWLMPATGVLAAWLATSSLLSHPDYLPYFNELAGSHPENILVDSDLDWGQDVKRLAKRLKEVGAKEITFGTLMIGEMETQHGLPHFQKEMDVMNPAPGWNAVSLTNWKEFRFGLLNRYKDYKLWPERYPPLERIGKGILLYYFDPATTPR